MAEATIEVASTGLTALDQFCGAGGTSQGAMAAGVEVRVAINHWSKAIATHAHNFPDVEHDCADVASVLPERYPTTDILLTSPECKAHSYARGRPKDDLTLFDPDKGAERSRATMWDVPRFAEVHDYKAIVVENVVSVVKWGHKKGHVGMDPGPLFRSWLMTMEALDYKWKVVSLNSQIVGVPQSRDRAYVVFWKKGQKAPNLDIRATGWCGKCEKVVDGIQTWRHRRLIQFGSLGRQYDFTCPTCTEKIALAITPSAQAIDFSIEAPLIRDRKFPLAASTDERIQLGFEVLKNRPRMVRLDSLGKGETIGSGCFGEGMGIVPLRRNSRAKGVDEALDTICASGNHHGLVIRSYGSPGGPKGKLGWQRDIESQVLGTVTTRNGYQFVSVPAASPERAGCPETFNIEDCGFRMLEPHELARAMSFGDDYTILGNKQDRVRQAGNAVTPPAATELVKRVAKSLI